MEKSTFVMDHGGIIEEHLSCQKLHFCENFVSNLKRVACIAENGNRQIFIVSEGEAKSAVVFQDPLRTKL